LHENTQTPYISTFLHGGNFSHSLLVKARIVQSRNLTAIEAGSAYPLSDNDSLYARATYELLWFTVKRKYDFARVNIGM
jgi:hypothetical protein